VKLWSIRVHDVTWQAGYLLLGVYVFFLVLLGFDCFARVLWQWWPDWACAVRLQSPMSNVPCCWEFEYCSLGFES